MIGIVCSQVVIIVAGVPASLFCPLCRMCPGESYLRYCEHQNITRLSPSPVHVPAPAAEMMFSVKQKWNGFRFWCEIHILLHYQCTINQFSMNNIRLAFMFWSEDGSADCPLISSSQIIECLGYIFSNVLKPPETEQSNLDKHRLYLTSHILMMDLNFSV